MAKSCKFCRRSNGFVCEDYDCEGCGMCASTSKEDKEK